MDNTKLGFIIIIMGAGAAIIKNKIVSFLFLGIACLTAVAAIFGVFG